MSGDPQAPQAAEAKVPLWKNPFVIAFAVGVVVITLVRPLSELFRSAPPPIRQLSPWALTSLGGGPASASALQGTVVLLSAELGPCDERCVERQTEFGAGARHVDDLGGKVIFLTLVGDEARAALEAQIAVASPLRRFAGTSAELQPLVAELQAALAQRQLERDQREGAPRVQFALARPVVLIDQAGNVRDFWPMDGAGRGNSINAARLLATRGPQP